MQNGTLAVAAAPAASTPGNMSLGTLTAMLQKPRTAAPAPSSAEGSTAESQSAEAPAGGEPAPAKARKRKPAAAPVAAPAAPAPEPEAAAAAEEPAAELGAGLEGEAQTGEEHEEAAEGAESEEQTETEGTETAKALPAEVAEAIAELKARGDKTGARLVKRIHTLVDARDTERIGRLQAEQRATQLQQQLQQRSPDAGTATPSGDRHASHPEVQALDQQLAQAEQVLDWVETNPDGAQMDDGKGGVKTFTPQEMAQYKRRAEANRDRLTAERAVKTAAIDQDSQARRQQFNTTARQQYPWLTKPTSPEFLEANAVLQAFPALRHAPAMELILARYVEGTKAERARLAKPAPAKTAPRTPPPVSTRASAAPSDNGTPAKGKADEAFVKTGRVSDLAKMFATKQKRAA